MLACLRSTAARYVGIWLIVNGLFPFIPILYMWLMANQMSESKKGLGLVIFATIGQCGPLLGTHLFPAKDQPYYHLLAENESSYYVAYVSEQNLMPDETGEPVDHPDLGDLFGEMCDGVYPLQVQLN